MTVPDVTPRPDDAAGLGRFGGPRIGPPGIYRVFWKEGGASLAAIGVGANGDRWLAPVNWIEPLTSRQACHPASPDHWSWATVERVELLMKASEAEPDARA